MLACPPAETCCSAPLKLWNLQEPSSVIGLSENAKHFFWFTAVLQKEQNEFLCLRQWDLSRVVHFGFRPALQFHIISMIHWQSFSCSSCGAFFIIQAEIESGCKPEEEEEVRRSSSSVHSPELQRCASA